MQGGALPGFGAAPRGLIITVLFLLLASLAHASDSEILMRQGRDAMAEGRLDDAEAAYLLVPAPTDEADDEGLYANARMQVARLRIARKDYDGAVQAARDVLAHYTEHAEAKNTIVSIERERMPAWERFLEDCWRFLPSLLQGAGMTLLLVFCTILISPVGGLIIALGRISSFRMLRAPCWLIIWLFRGTPLLLQLFFIYYGLPSLGDHPEAPVGRAHRAGGELFGLPGRDHPGRHRIHLARPDGKRPRPWA